MDDFAAHVDGRAEGLESDLDDVDGADYSGAETTWFEQQHPLFATRSVARTLMGTVMGNGFNGSSGHISKYTNVRVGAACSRNLSQPLKTGPLFLGQVPRQTRDTR